MTSSAPAGSAPAGQAPVPAHDGEDERTRLTRDAVTGRALELADAGGTQSLTIRKLATDLGVTPMALYWHFRSKDELLAGVADRIWSEVDIEVDWSAPWLEQFRKLFTSLLAALRAHPAGSQLLLTVDKLHCEAAMTVTEVALEVLLRAGFSDQDACGVNRSAMWTAIMLVLAEPGREYAADPEARAEEQRKNQVRLATQSQARFPRLVECAALITSCDDPDQHYAFGVELFLAGVKAIAAARAKNDRAENA